MSYLKKFAIFVGAFLLTLLALEVFLRFTGTQLPGFTRYDETLGLALKPDRPLVRFNEGFYMGATNHYGYYGKSRPYEKPPGTFRVALIGDSQVEAHQLFARDHFGEIMERELQARTGVPVEVLNFGQSGLNLSDMYCYYSDFATRFHPDVVLFLIGPGDIDNSPPSNVRPYCEMVGDSLVINYGFARSSGFQWLLKTSALRGNSAVLTLVNSVVQLCGRGLAAEIILGKFYRGDGGKAMAAGTERVASETTLAILRELSERENVYFLMEDNMDDTLVTRVARDYGHVIDLRGALQHVDGDPRYWVATDKRGHWNRAAHRAVGMYLADVLAARVAGEDH